MPPLKLPFSRIHWRTARSTAWAHRDRGCGARAVPGAKVASADELGRLAHVGTQGDTPRMVHEPHRHVEGVEGVKGRIDQEASGIGVAHPIAPHAQGEPALLAEPREDVVPPPEELEPTVHGCRLTGSETFQPRPLRGSQADPLWHGNGAQRRVDAGATGGIADAGDEIHSSATDRSLGKRPFHLEANPGKSRGDQDAGTQAGEAAEQEVALGHVVDVDRVATTTKGSGRA